MEKVEELLLKLGTNLRQLRIKKRFSQTDIQQRTGLSIRTLCLLERGDIDPKFSTLCKVADALGISVEKIFKINLIK